MKLISLQIDNFGTLKDYKCLFHDGINTIVHENGWGKSTLASFIRIMFFGFDNEGKRSELENERKRFQPWQGGGYGGMLVFEAKGKTYRIERTFNEKKESTFELYDAKTNLKSSDYTEKIGEELFGIDSDSFERTVFIGQQDCETKATSAINAKIGNVDDIDDMGRFSIVQEKLKKEADSLTPYRKTGAIARLKDDLASREVRIAAKASHEEHREEILDQIKRLGLLQEENKKKLKSIREEMKEVSLQKDRFRLRREYEGLMEEAKKAREKKEEIMRSFPGEVPQEDVLGEMVKKATDLAGLDRSMRDLRLSEDERKEEERIYDTYVNGFPEDEEISRLLALCAESANRKNVLPSKKANLKLMQEMKKKERLDEKRRNTVRVIAGILFFVIAAAAFVLGFSKNLPALAAYAVAGVAALAGAMSLLSMKKIKRQMDETAIELAKSIDDDERFIQKTEETAREFLDSLGEKGEVKDIAAFLEGVKEDSRKQRELSKKREGLDGTVKEREMMVKEINDFLSGYGEKESVDPSGGLLRLKDRMNDLKNAADREKEADEKLAVFLKDHDGADSFEDAAEPEKDLNELDEEFSIISDEVAKEEENLRKYEEELDGCNEVLEDIAADEEEIENLKEKAAELQYRYDIISDTREYLEKAKASFTGRYMEPVKRAFDKYYSVLSPDDGREYELDANLGISVRNRGVSRDTGLLSGGYRDLVGLCRRMAMIEAMYEEERPFLILDDPFVNLDNDRVKGGINLLKRISEPYQIIYFTCHDSRAI
ncbi:MAG: AAA family ATPase [Lachnospiraceae bacterium]|nr:AAA family ATPase [Lachnospiraceae bacterium]